MADRYTFYNKSEYIKYLIRQAATAKTNDKIYLATLSFDPSDKLVAQLCDQLIGAAKRGAEVIFLVDAYAFLAHQAVKPGPLFWSKNLDRSLTRRYKAKYDFLKSLDQAGGIYRILNKPSKSLSRPFAGRSHIKYALVNDTVIIGSANLNDSSFIELLVGTESTALTKIIADFTKKLVKTGSVLDTLDNDTFLKLGPTENLIIDRGKTRQSLIYTEALKAIDNADEFIYFFCQYFPNNTTLSHLINAHKRGVEVNLYYNHPRNRDRINGALHTMVKLVARTNTPKHFFTHEQSRNSPYIHAKLLVTDKTVMIGSHNFVEAGVKFGTAELVLQSKDRLFSKRAVQKLTDLLA